MKYQTNLRAERKKRKWTLGFVGKEIGVKKQTVHDWEKGRRYPGYVALCSLEDLFQLSMCPKFERPIFSRWAISIWVRPSCFRRLRILFPRDITKSSRQKKGIKNTLWYC